MWPPLKSTWQNVAPTKSHIPKCGPPWRGRRTTLAGPADDPAQTADNALQKTGGDGRAYRRWGGERPDPGGAGERPWRGRRATLAGTGVLVLAKYIKKSLASDPGGDGGRPWRGATLALQDVHGPH